MAALSRAFALSTSWLGVYRVLLGSIILLDLLARAVSLNAHYTDVGVLPRAFLVEQVLDQGYLSLHLVSGTASGMAVLFALNAALALLLIAGVWPRVMAGLCFVFLASLHTRNPMLVAGGDNLLRVMLFWSMFVPLGRAARDEADVREPEPDLSRDLSSLGTAAYILQLCFMYWFTFLLKTGAPWREDFSALEQALHFEHYTKAAGFALLGVPSLLAPLTLAVLVLEALGPLLLFIPWRRDLWRTLTVALFWAFHLGIALTMEIGLFPWICLVVWIPLLPEALARRLAKALPAPLLAWARPRLATRPCPLTSPELRPGARALVLALLTYVLAWNIRTLDLQRYQTYFPREYSLLGKVLHIDQYWRLFTPAPPDDSGWFVVPVRLHSGQSFDT